MYWFNFLESPINGYRRFATKKDVFVAHINEFKTSRWCYTCGHEMTYSKKLMYQDGSVYNSFGVLCCSNSNCGISINRDVNAARDIHQIFSNYLNDFERVPRISTTLVRGEKKRSLYSSFIPPVSIFIFGQRGKKRS